MPMVEKGTKMFDQIIVSLSKPKEPEVVFNLKAIHCTKCGILVGYRRFDVDILCVNCGQALL